MSTIVSSNPPENFESLEGYARFQPVGEPSLSEAAQLVAQAIAYAREHQIPRLLVNATSLPDGYQLSITNRYYITRQFASEARGFVKIAFVPKPEVIDPGKFGIAVGFNAGLRTNAFIVESDALAWLLDDKTG